ncbi:MAG: hypothetical protein J6T51_03975 [Kiritimatiellae bacterium]|nr:hypothetical protein [Kiritimatiellia bacterium]
MRRLARGPIIDFLKGRGLRVHGHILVTGGFRPDWLFTDFCPEAEKKFLEGKGLPRRETFDGYWKTWEMEKFRVEGRRRQDMHDAR